MTRAASPSIAPALTSLAVGGFAIGTTEFVTMGLLPGIARGLDVSIPAAGRVISAYALGVVVGAPLLAVLTARIARTRLLMVLMGAFALGNVASALAPSYGSLVVARFLSGVPHGAYFGIASLVAVSMADPGRRGRAAAFPLFGLTAANVAGVPASSWLGQQLGWRAAYWFVALVGVVTVTLVWRLVPHVAAHEGASRRQEMRALAKGQVWVTMAIGAVGFGGIFAVYSYIAPLLTEVTGWQPAAVPIALAVFGIGMTVGTVLGGRLADWSVPRALVLGFTLTLGVLASFPLAAHSRLGIVVAVASLGIVGSITVNALQLRLMDTAGAGSASLGASLNHSALNLANASGAFLGGLVIDAGFGWTSPAWVGAGLAAIGLALATASVLFDRRPRQQHLYAGRAAADGRAPA